MNKISKGNYYVKKTKEFLEKEGWVVEKSEINFKIWTPKGIFFKKKDLFGADLICINGKDIVFVQVKTNKVDVNKGLAEFKKYPFPAFVKKWVVIWPVRAREPQVKELEL